jgi:hypothetical protein
VAGEPWFEGCLTGVGDAAHATTPYLGQGGAMALEVRGPVARSGLVTPTDARRATSGSLWKAHDQPFES